MQIDQLGNVAIGTASAMFVKNNGNVGIGTTNPGLGLEVGGVLGYPATSGSAQNGAARFGSTTINNVLDIGQGDSGSYALWLQGSSRANLAITYPITLQPNGGGVGIGTSSPSSPLHVAASGSVGNPGGIRVSDVANASKYMTLGIGSPVDSAAMSILNQSGNDLIIGSATTTPVRLMANAEVRLSILPNGAGNVNGVDIPSVSMPTATNAVGLAVAAPTSATNNYTAVFTGGNVGIGTTTPLAFLEVAGTGTNSAILVPRDTTLNRPANNARNGMIRYNTNTSKFEAYENTGWVNMIGSTSFPLFAPISNSSAPSYSFSSDANTGMFSPLADNLNFATTGVSRLQVDQLGNVAVGTTSQFYVSNSGNVGIGTTSPTQKLDVQGNINLGSYNSQNSITIGGAVAIQTQFLTTGNHTTFSDIGQNYGLSLVGRNVGVGYVGPFEAAYNLDARDAAANGRAINAAQSATSGTVYGVYSTATGAATTNIAGYFSASGAANNYGLIVNSGNVGIGTTTPLAFLEVAGTGTNSAILVPRDTTANRPGGNARNGMIRYNTNTSKFEAYENTGWTNMIGAASFPLFAPISDASAPSYSFSSDANTGMFSPLADNLNLATSGVSRLQVDQLGNVAIGTTSLLYVSNSGNVGIGTLAPSAKLTVAGDIQINNQSTITTVAANSGVVTLAQRSNSGGQFMYAGAALSTGTDNDTSGSVAIVGIGGTNSQFTPPSGSANFAALNISPIINGTSSGTAYGEIIASKTNVLTGGKIKLLSVGTTTTDAFTGYTELLGIDSNGLVGIGTSTPLALLEVAGTGTNSAILVPRDTTANRPGGNARNGMIRYNTNTSKFEAYENTGWTNIIGSTSFPLFAPISNSSAPSYSFSSDANTGMFSPLADNLNLSTTGVSRLQIDQLGNVAVGTTSQFYVSNSGNIGIGTTAPATSLHIITSGNQGFINLGTADVNGIRLGPADPTGGVLGVWQGDGTTKAGVKATFVEDYVSSNFRLGTGATLDFSSAGTVRWGATTIATIDSGLSRGGVAKIYVGNGTAGDSSGTLVAATVGIGTTTPLAFLEVAGTGTNSAILIPRDTTANRPGGNARNGMIRFNTNTSKFEAYENTGWVNMIGGAPTFPLAAPISNSSAPSYSFSSDANTGMFSPLADNLNLATTGVSRLQVDQLGNVAIGTTSQFYVSNSGNVGIGTTSPTGKFEVIYNAVGTSISDGIVLKNNTAATAGDINSLTRQNSPALSFVGQGWKENATAASQPIAFKLYTIPAEDAASPDGLFVIDPFVNGVQSGGGIGICSTGGYSSPKLILDGNYAAPRVCNGNTPGAGFSSGGAGLISVIAGIQVANIGQTGFLLSGGSGLGWISGGALNGEPGNGDVGLSRGAAGKLYLGNGTVGNTSGTLVAGAIGIGTTTPLAFLEVAGTGTNSAILVPRDTTLNRPGGNARNGMIRYNTNTSKFEAYENTGWTNIIGSTSFPLFAPISNSSAPSYSFSSDANTGMFSPLADNLNLATTGVSRLQVDQLGNVAIGTTSQFYVSDSGNVGIGTTSPTAGFPLTVMTNSAGYREIAIYNTAGGNAGYYLNSGGKGYSNYVTAATDAYQVFSDTAGTTVFSIYNNGGASLGSFAGAIPPANGLLVPGNVGIGTTTPLAFLEVAGTGTNSAILVPRDTTLNRPGGNARNGMIRYNTNTSKFEAYENTGWTNMIGSTSFPLFAPISNASAPSYSFSSDANTGMFSPLADNLNFATTGVSRLQIDQLGNVAVGTTSQFYVSNSGNVGIGTTSPAYQLTLVGSGSTAGLYAAVLGIGNQLGVAGDGLTQASNSGFSLHTGGSSPTTPVYTFKNDEDTGLFNPVGNSIAIATAGIERLRVDGSGNVGIGTTTPLAFLEVAGTGTNSAILVPRDTTLNRPGGNARNGMIRYNTNTSKFEAYESGSWTNVIGGSSSGNSGALQYSNGSGGFLSNNNIIMDGSNGRIGIGTTAPTNALDVAGLTQDTVYSTSDGARFHDGNLGVNLGGNASGGYGWISASNSGVGPANLVINRFGGSVGIGAVPNGIIDASGNNVIFGSDDSAYTRTTGVGKTARLMTLHYNTSEENVGIFMSSSSSSANEIYFGGGSGMANAATGLHFYTAANNITTTGSERLTISSAGNVGIGTTTPLALLEVTGTGTNSAIFIPRDTTANRPGGNARNGMLRYNTNTSKFEAYENGAWANMIGGGGSSQWNNGASSSINYTAGYVGIGTTSPAARLHIYQGGINLENDPNVDPWMPGKISSTNIGTSSIELQAARGTLGSKSAVSNNDVVGALQFFGYDGSNMRPTGAITSIVNGTPGTNDMPGALYFWTTPDGSSTSQVRMSVAPSGNVGVGTTDPDVGGGWASQMRLLTVVGDGSGSNYSSGSLILANNRVTPAAGDLAGALWFRSLNNGSQPGVALISSYLDGSGGGNGLGSYLAMSTKPDNGTLAERLRIDSTGNVGIGTTTPLALLEVTGTGTNSAILVPRDTTANRPSNNARNGMLRYNTNTSKFEAYQSGSWTNMITLGSGSSSGANGAIQFSDGAGAFLSNNNIVMDNTNGRLGIGTTTPNQKLEVAGNIKASGAIVGGVATDSDALTAITVDFANSNMIAATGAAADCGTLNFTNVTAGGNYTVTILNATKTCTAIQLSGATTNVKLPSGYGAGGVACSGVVYTAIYDGTTLWISYVPF